LLLTLSKTLTLSNQQAQLFLQLYSFESANQPVPADLVTRLRARTARNRGVLASGERQLAALPPGTPQGRVFKQASLRYLHEVAGPLNECIEAGVVAKTVKQLGDAVTCFDSRKRAGTKLQSAINSSMTQLVSVRRCTLTR